MLPLSSSVFFFFLNVHVDFGRYYYSTYLQCLRRPVFFPPDDGSLANNPPNASISSRLWKSSCQKDILSLFLRTTKVSSLERKGPQSLEPYLEAYNTYHCCNDPENKYVKLQTTELFLLGAHPFIVPLNNQKTILQRERGPYSLEPNLESISI